MSSFSLELEYLTEFTVQAFVAILTFARVFPYHIDAGTIMLAWCRKTIVNICNDSNRFYSTTAGYCFIQSGICLIAVA